MSDEKYILSEEEQVKVLDAWNNNVTKIKDIIIYVFGPGMDGRSKQGIAVKDFLASLGNKSQTTADKETKIDKVELSEEDKEFIRKNRLEESPIRNMELCRIIFKDRDLGPLSAQFRVLKSYIDSLDTTEKKKYTPPKTIEQVVARTNNYLGTELDSKTLTIRDKECMQCVLKYTNVYRFVMEMNLLICPEDREFFESQFFRYTFSKQDLVHEDIDLYIDVCKAQIRQKYLEIEYTQLDQIKNETMEDGTFSKTLFEGLSEIRKDINALTQKTQATLQSLNKKRSERMDNLNKSFGSVLNLVEAMRAEETRNKWAALAKIEEAKKDVEKERIGGLSELMFEVFGISKGEV